MRYYYTVHSQSYSPTHAHTAVRTRALFRFLRCTTIHSVIITKKERKKKKKNTMQTTISKSHNVHSRKQFIFSAIFLSRSFYRFLFSVHCAFSTHFFYSAVGGTYLASESPRHSSSTLFDSIVARVYHFFLLYYFGVFAKSLCVAVAMFIAACRIHFSCRLIHVRA